MIYNIIINHIFQTQLEQGCIMIYNITIIGNKLHFQTQLDCSPAFLCIPASFLCIPVHSCAFLCIPVHSCLIPVDSCGSLWNPEIPEGICGAVRSTGKDLRRVWRRLGPFCLCGPALACVGRHWLLWAFMGLHWLLWGFGELCWPLLAVVGCCGLVWACVGLWWPSLAAMGLCCQ